MTNTFHQLLTEIEKHIILAEADDMLEGLYHFHGIWDMEPIPEPVSNKDLNWSISYNGDSEYAYMFTRMDYLYKLILATEISGDAKYIRHGLMIVDRWFQDDWIHLGSISRRIYRHFFYKNNHGHRTLDMAIMISNMVDYIKYCHEHHYISLKQHHRYQQNIERIIDYLIHYSDQHFKLACNWGILENGNIVYSLLQLDSNRHLEIASARLIRQVHHQILSDGSQVEASPMYLVQILLVLLKLLNEPKCDLREQLIKPIAKGCEYIKSIRTSDNCIPNIGDSDLTNISDLMILAAKILHDDEYLKYVNKSLDIEFCIKYGVDRHTAQHYEVDATFQLTQYRFQTVYRQPQSGTYLLCSNLPKLVDGHKHYDYLSVLYSENGKEILVDSGRYTYKNNEDRQFYLGPMAHNTIHVTSHPFYKYLDSWNMDQRIDCCENRVIQEDNHITIKMACVFGYSELKVERYVTYINKIGVAITDVIGNNHSEDYQCETIFNIGSDVIYQNDKSIPTEQRVVKRSLRYNEQIDQSQLVIGDVPNRLTHFFLTCPKEIKVFYSDSGIEYLIAEDDIKISIPLSH